MNQQVVSENRTSESTMGSRKINPVYAHWRELVNKQYSDLHNEFKVDSTRLSDAVRGCRCFYKRTGIFKDFEELQPYLGKYETDIKFVADDALFTLEDYEDSSQTAMVVYSSSSNPTNLIRGGQPCILTDLAARSNLLWQLKSPAMYKKDSDKLNQLFASTLFFLPNVEWKDSWKRSKTSNVLIMSSMEAVLEHLETVEMREEINMGKLFQIKLETPLWALLRANVKRAELGLAPIEHIIFDDLQIRSHTVGINSLFTAVLNNVLRSFDGAFKSITFCIRDSSTLRYVTTVQDLE